MNVKSVLQFVGVHARTIYTIKRTTSRMASEAALALSVARLMHEARSERWPTSPAIPVDVLRDRLIQASPPTGAAVWLAFDPNGDAVGHASLAPNILQRTASASIFVRRHHRRRHIARQLLAHIARDARHAGVDVLHVSTTAHIPGSEFALRLDGTPRKVVIHAERPINTWDHSLLECSKTNANTTVVRITDALASDKLLISIGELRGAIDRRYGSGHSTLLDHTRVAQMRHYFEQLHRNYELWLFVALDSDGTCVGYNQYSWDPHQPAIAHHVGMSVAESHRNRGVAAQLLAARGEMLRLRPSIDRIRLIIGPVAEQHISRRNKSIPRHAEGYDAHYVTRWCVSMYAVNDYLARQGAKRLR